MGWEPLHGCAEVVAMYRSWVEIAPDAEFRFEVIAEDGERALITFGAWAMPAPRRAAERWSTACSRP